MVAISDTQRYKMCGNGVVSRVVEEVVKAQDGRRENLIQRNKYAGK